MEEQNHYCILTNNLNFYIIQFFKALNDFLGVSFLSKKFNINLIKSFLSFIKQRKSSYFFEWQKSKHAKGGQSSKTISFFVKKRNKAKPAEAKTTPFRIRNSLVKTLSLRGDSRSNLFCLDCSAHARNDKFKIYNKNNFAILNNNVSFASACRWQAHCYLTLLTSITFDSLSSFAVRYIAGSIQQLSFNLDDKTYETANNMVRQ